MEVALLLLGTRLQVPLPKTLTDKVELAPFCTLESCTQKNSTSQHTSLGPISQTREIVCAPICTLKNCTFVIFWNICNYETNLLFIQNRKQGIHFFSTLWAIFCWKLSLSYVAPFLFLFVLEFWTNHVLRDVAHKRKLQFPRNLELLLSVWALWDRPWIGNTFHCWYNYPFHDLGIFQNTKWCMIRPWGRL